MALAGCLDFADEDVPCADFYREFAFLPSPRFADTTHDQSWDMVFWAWGDNATGNLTISANADGEMVIERVPSQDLNQSLFIGRLPNGRAGDVNVEARASLKGVDGCFQVDWKTERVSRTPKPDGELATTGQGAHVYTAGFWTNGTLFYTNIAEVDSSTWPRAGWYAFEGGEALPVYVYDKDRGEKPAYWGQEHEIGPVGQRIGREYFTTIAGFNEALKGLSTATERVVVIPPEKAYTLPGNEEHPLYGDALVFYIRVVDVVDVPCDARMPSPACDLPVDPPKG